MLEFGSFFVGERCVSKAHHSLPRRKRRTRRQRRQFRHNRDADDLPHLQALLAEAAVTTLDNFETRMTTVLAGIAARRGDDWSAIASKVEGVITAHR